MKHDKRKFIVDVVMSVSARIPIAADDEDDAKRLAIEAFELDPLIKPLIDAEYLDTFDYDIYDIGEV